MYLITLSGVLCLVCISLFIFQKSLREEFIICDSNCNLEIMKHRFGGERNTLLQQVKHLRSMVSDILGKDFKFEKPMNHIQNLPKIAANTIVSDMDTKHFCTNLEQTWIEPSNTQPTNRKEIVKHIIDVNSQYDEHLSILFMKRKEALKQIDAFANSIRTLTPNMTNFCDGNDDSNCDMDENENIFEESERIQGVLASQYQQLLSSICLVVNYARGTHQLAKLSKQLGISLSTL